MRWLRQFSEELWCDGQPSRRAWAAYGSVVLLSVALLVGAFVSGRIIAGAIFLSSITSLAVFMALNRR